jgi:hypothetical protein
MKGRKRINTEQKWIKGETPGISKKKKNPTGGMDVWIFCTYHPDTLYLREQVCEYL